MVHQAVGILAHLPSALAISTLLLSPPLSRIPIRARIGSILKISKQFFYTRLYRLLRSIFKASAAIKRFSSTVRSLKILDSWGKISYTHLCPFELRGNWVTCPHHPGRLHSTGCISQTTYHIE